MDQLPDIPDEDALLRDLLDPRNRPRPHHYLFAHRILPGRLWDAPDFFLDNLYGLHTIGFLLTRWGEAGMQLEDSEFLPPEEKLRCDFSQLAGGYRLAVISLPEAERIGEAHMVAVVTRPPQRRLLFLKTKPVLRYFTLEFGYDGAGRPRTVFCEWTPDSHVNYGDGPAATPAEFAAAIERFLSIGQAT